MSSVQVRRTFPNGVKLASPRRSFRRDIVNDVPSD